MNQKEIIEFEKRYDKFKKNNLPTPFWDDERRTLEYVYFRNGKSFITGEKEKDVLEVYPNLTDALGDVSFAEFYYPFINKQIISYPKDGKRVNEIVVEHNHAHLFEEVVRELYYTPESFRIEKKDEEYYSKQELEYLRRVQKYLLFLGLKDFEKERIPASRYRNKIRHKYESVFIHRFRNKLIEDIKNKNLNFKICHWEPYFDKNDKFKPQEFRALIVDEEDNFKLFVEYTKEITKYYKDVKNLYEDDRFKDDDKVRVRYFKVLKIF